MPMEQYNTVEQTRPIQQLQVKLLFPVSRMQKISTGFNNFVKWKGTFWSNCLKWADLSKWTTFRGSPIYSGRTEPKLALPFDF